MKKTSSLSGHIGALITIFLWGTTFISTKVLLRSFQPVEILLIRFIIGAIALFLIYPKIFKFTSWKREGTFALAGLLGISLYYLCENLALTYTLAANIGVIVSVSPLFIAILSAVLDHKRLSGSFMAGFVLAIAGIALISFNGTGGSGHGSIVGDVLALLAAVIWALYSYIVTRMNTFYYNSFQMTRRTFMYGIIFILPIFWLTHGSINLPTLAEPLNLANILFLGLGASALCFLLWTFVVQKLGPVQASIYLYLVPVVNVIAAWLILKEPITPAMIVGIVLTIGGLVLSAR
ncbi:DMT family transporter [Furfurilactobacillus rossiae]|uniref:EamA domain-containing protein n=1 Tax=Furfurilactobacillus rossiae DSM 15814 TaxID=1114972 RepID=A0A0R1RKX2_9LACO|nr:DMT family transporter [Furfurilactobacillus rossiae]KRL55828.1 hypothetical protein FD35_GL002360 [Furfurilactobacillus rossiae DSM 15814]QFR67225.1 EamA family transporter [Furfurilactobacillus rossiae]QLE60150.1 Permease of the drug-metabolite transporter DMT [Furfurilactobacillus rossiae]